MQNFTLGTCKYKAFWLSTGALSLEDPPISNWVLWVWVNLNYRFTLEVMQASTYICMDFSNMWPYLWKWTLSRRTTSISNIYQCL